MKTVISVVVDYETSNRKCSTQREQFQFSTLKMMLLVVVFFLSFWPIALSFHFVSSSDSF